MFFLSRRNQTRLYRRIDRYERHPGEAEMLAVVAELRRAGRLDEAFSWARQARADFPDSRRLGRLYRRVRSQKIRLLVRDLRARLRRDPSAECLLKLSDLLRICGAWRRARRLALRAAEELPGDGRASLVLGKLYLERFGRTGSEDDGWTAVEHLEEARAANRESYETLLTLAITLTRLESYQSALETLEEILASRPDDPRALGLREYAEAALERRIDATSEPDEDEQEAEEDREGRAGGRKAPAAPLGSEVSTLLERASGLPGAAGAFLLDQEGTVASSWVEENTAFDFTAPVEPVQAMAAACRTDLKRLGLGDLVSCTLGGDGWLVHYRPVPAGQLAVFFTGELSCGQSEQAVADLAAGAPGPSEREGMVACARS